MSKLIDILKGIFEGEKAITNEDGQKVVTFDAILPEVEGLTLFDESVGSDSAQQVNDSVNIDLSKYATADQLTELINRLIALEGIVTAVDELKNVPSEEVELW